MTDTCVPVAFSNPMAMPWHQAVLGERQYMLSWACATAGMAVIARASSIEVRGWCFIGSGRESQRHCDCGGLASFDLRTHFLVPLLEQSLALRGCTVFREVVVDELDVRRFWRQRRYGCAHIRRQLELLGLRGKKLRLGRQCPVVEFLRTLQITRALDDRHRADFVAGAFAGRDTSDRKTRLRFGHDVV